jgi:hypothetical protein
MAPGCDVRLQMHSGIPVVVVQGEWVSATARDLAATIRDLVGAGHYEIILNVQRVAALGAGVLRSLQSLAVSVREHHGHLDVVGTVDQVRVMLEPAENALFRLSTTEARAISRIKRVPVCVAGMPITSRLRVAGESPQAVRSGCGRH